LGKTADDKNTLVSNVLLALDDIDFGLEASQEIDILGDAYEYMISQFAAGAGKKAGEFYTPQEVSRILAEIVSIGHQRLRNVYDPTCGSGSLLLRAANIGNAVDIYGQEKNIAAMPSVTTLLHEGKTPEDMMQLALAGFDPNVLDERDVHYQCDCSAERTKEMLFSLGRKELVRMRDEDPACEVVCHFCHSKYQYDLNDLLAEYDAQAAERAAAEQGT
jgi:hypothetical protein